MVLHFAFVWFCRLVDFVLLETAALNFEKLRRRTAAFHFNGWPTLHFEYLCLSLHRHEPYMDFEVTHSGSLQLSNPILVNVANLHFAFGLLVFTGRLIPAKLPVFQNLGASTWFGEAVFYYCASRRTTWAEGNVNLSVS